MKTVACRLSAALAALLCASFSLAAEARADKKDAAPAAPGGIGKTYEGLEFRNIGPFRGGRVTAVAGVRGQPLVYYQGATGGGVWKTVDGGSNWQPMSDKFFKTGSVGAIGVAESDPNVIYVGMGEAPIRGNVSHGDGVYKSTDAGKTWTNVGLRNTSPDLPRAGEPARSGPRLRGRAGPRLGSQRGARDLPLEGWRQDLGEGAVCQRQDGRVGSLHGSEQPADPLRGHVAGIPQAVDARVRRRRGRGLPVDGRRRHVEKLSGGLPEGVVGNIGVTYRAPGATASGRSSRRRRAASSGATTAERSGRRPTPRTSSGSAPGITRGSTRIRRTRMRSTS